MASSELTYMEKLLREIIVIFDQYVITDDRKASLTPGKFKELVHQQLPHFMKNLGDLDKKMRSLDVNNDQRLEFKEYWWLIGELLITDFRREELGKN